MIGNAGDLDVFLFSYRTHWSDPQQFCDEFADVWNDVRVTAETGDFDEIHIELIDDRTLVFDWPPIRRYGMSSVAIYEKNAEGTWSESGWGAYCQSVHNKRSGTPP